MKKIILTEGTEFEQNMKDMALIDTDFREGKPTMLDSDEVNEAFTNSDQDVKDKFNFDLNGEEITITPTTSQQVITPSAGKNAITKATVNAAPLETAEVTPTTSAQTVTATGTGKIGLSSVSVAAVTSSIDANITAGNIKKDVSILGVTGTFEGGVQMVEDFRQFQNGQCYAKRVFFKQNPFTITDADLAEYFDNLVGDGGGSAPDPQVLFSSGTKSITANQASVEDETLTIEISYVDSQAGPSRLLFSCDITKDNNTLTYQSNTNANQSAGVLIVNEGTVSNLDIEPYSNQDYNTYLAKLGIMMFEAFRNEVDSYE